MSYDAWKLELTASKQGVAQVANLEAEKRIPDEVLAFKKVLITEFTNCHTAGFVGEEAAKRALEAAINVIWGKKTDWLCLLKFPDAAHLPATVGYTHISAYTVGRRYPSPTFDCDNPPPKLRAGGADWRTPLSSKVFVWATFSHDGRSLPDDPTRLVVELGLPHYKAGDSLYRIEYPLVKDALYIPTCLDACLYEAWAPPPVGHVKPWGMTRNLETGANGWPELLLIVEALPSTAPEFTLVSGGTPRGMIGSYSIDYTIGRN